MGQALDRFWTNENTPPRRGEEGSSGGGGPVRGGVVLSVHGASSYFLSPRPLLPFENVQVSSYDISHAAVAHRQCLLASPTHDPGEDRFGL